MNIQKIYKKRILKKTQKRIHLTRKDNESIIFIVFMSRTRNLQQNYRSWTAAMAGFFFRSLCVIGTRKGMNSAAGPVIRILTICSSIATSSRDPPAATARYGAVSSSTWHSYQAYYKLTAMEFEKKTTIIFFTTWASSRIGELAGCLFTRRRKEMCVCVSLQP